MGDPRMVRAPRDGHARSTATLDGAESPGPGSVSRQLDGPSITAESISVRSIGALAGHGAGAFQAWGSAPLRRLSGLWTWPCHPISAGPILPSVPNRMAFQPLIKTPAMGRGLSTSVGRELDGWVACRHGHRLLGMFGRRQRLAGLERASQAAQLWRERRRDGPPLPWCRVDCVRPVAHLRPMSRSSWETTPFHNCGGCCGKARQPR